MQSLIDTIQKVLPAVIQEVNDIRIPALENAWGRSFHDEMQNEEQVTVEIAKNYARLLNNCFCRHIQNHLPDFHERTTNGSDYEFQGMLIEDKNSFSDNNGWVGNGFKKTPMHLLKKFSVNDQGRITRGFLALVDLSVCNSAWSDKTIDTNRSVIQFQRDDLNHIQVIHGSIKVNQKYLRPILHPF